MNDPRDLAARNAGASVASCLAGLAIHAGLGIVTFAKVVFISVDNDGPADDGSVSIKLDKTVDHLTLAIVPDLVASDIA